MDKIYVKEQRIIRRTVSGCLGDTAAILWTLLYEGLRVGTAAAVLSQSPKDKGLLADEGAMEGQ